MRKALKRVAPDEVAARKREIERRIIRRVYSMEHYGQAGHLDYNCKATLPGGVRLYSYGHVRIVAAARVRAVPVSLCVRVYCVRACVRSACTKKPP